MSDEQQGRRTLTQEIELAGTELVRAVKDLVAKGNVRRVIIRTKGGRELMEVPLNASLAVGSVVVLAAPVLAAIGAAAALLGEVRLEVQLDPDLIEAEVVSDREDS